MIPPVSLIFLDCPLLSASWLAYQRCRRVFSCLRLWATSQLLKCAINFGSFLFSCVDSWAFNTIVQVFLSMSQVREKWDLIHYTMAIQKCAHGCFRHAEFQRIFFPWRPGVFFAKGAAEVKLLKGLEIDSLKLSKSNMAFYAMIGLYTQRHYFSLKLRPALEVLPCRTVNMISLWAGKTSGHEYRENKARWGLLKNSRQFLCICAALMLTENKQYMYYSAFFSLKHSETNYLFTSTWC